MREHNHELTTNELTEILDRLQDRIECSPYEQEVTVLKGSYGVYLYDLRRKDARTAREYIAWMQEYNRTTQQVKTL